APAGGLRRTVALNRHRPGPDRPRLLPRRRALARLPPRDRDGGPRLGEPSGHPEADAAIAAGDDRDLAREIEELHARYLPVPVPTDPRRRGSRVSRRPSPRRFRLSPASVKAMPGNRLTQNASRMTFFPLAMTLPHAGTYCVPPPPND